MAPDAEGTLERIVRSSTGVTIMYIRWLIRRPSQHCSSVPTPAFTFKDRTRSIPFGTSSVNSRYACASGKSNNFRSKTSGNKIKCSCAEGQNMLLDHTAASSKSERTAFRAWFIRYFFAERRKAKEKSLHFCVVTKKGQFATDGFTCRVSVLLDMMPTVSHLPTAYPLEAAGVPQLRATFE